MKLSGSINSLGSNRAESCCLCESMLQNHAIHTWENCKAIVPIPKASSLWGCPETLNHLCMNAHCKESDFTLLQNLCLAQQRPMIPKWHHATEKKTLHTKCIYCNFIYWYILSLFNISCQQNRSIFSRNWKTECTYYKTKFPLKVVFKIQNKV